MKKSLYLLAGIALALAVSSWAAITGGILQHTHSSASTGGNTITPTFINGAPQLNGVAVSFAACASGYTRQGPNLCIRNTQPTSTVLTAASCQTISGPATSIKSLILSVWIVAKSQGVAASQIPNTVDFSATAGCAPVQVTILQSTREYVATTAGTIINETRQQIRVPAEAGTGQVYALFTSAAGSQVAQYVINGYTD
jgi:hypothetical protein